MSLPGNRRALFCRRSAPGRWYGGNSALGYSGAGIDFRANVVSSVGWKGMAYAGGVCRTGSVSRIRWWPIATKRPAPKTAGCRSTAGWIRADTEGSGGREADASRLNRRRRQDGESLPGVREEGRLPFQKLLPRRIWRSNQGDPKSQKLVSILGSKTEAVGSPAVGNVPVAPCPAADNAA